MTTPRPLSVALAALLLTLLGCGSSSSPAPPSFATSDLAGRWQFSTVLDGPSVAAGGAIGWRRGVLTIDSTGVVTYVSALDSAGTTSVPSTQPVLQVDGQGVVTGTLQGATALHGQLSRDRALLVFTADQGTSPSLRVWQRLPPGITFAAADLVGAWRYHELKVGGQPAWEHGLATVAVGGGLSLGQRFDAAGAQPDLPGYATLTVDGQGFVTSSANPDWWGLLSADRSRLVAVQTVDAASHTYGLNVILRAGRAFAQADLAGEFAYRMLAEGTGPAWERGRLTVAADGATQVLEPVDAAGPSTPPAPFTLTLATDGQVVISGTTGADLHGMLSEDGALLAATQTLDAGTVGLVLVVRR